jgi:hypothetical protein
MTRVLLVAVICFCVGASIASAQSIDGSWTTGLHARGPNGRTITITLNSDGQKVTGTLYGSQPIPEGTMEGNTLKVTVKVPTVSGSELLMNYVAILDGDELKFTYQSENGRLPVFGPAAKEFTAKRVN